MVGSRAVVGSTPRIRVPLSDDQPIMRVGLRAILEREPGIEVVAEAGTGRAAVAVARRLQPTVVVMDITEPCPEAIEAIRLLSTPGAERPAGVALSHGEEPGHPPLGQSQHFAAKSRRSDPGRYYDLC